MRSIFTKEDEAKLKKANAEAEANLKKANIALNRRKGILRKSGRSEKEVNSILTKEGLIDAQMDAIRNVVRNPTAERIRESENFVSERRVIPSKAYFEPWIPATPGRDTRNARQKRVASRREQRR